MPITIDFHFSVLKRLVGKEQSEKKRNQSREVASSPYCVPQNKVHISACTVRMLEVWGGLGTTVFRTGPAGLLERSGIHRNPLATPLSLKFQGRGWTAAET